MVHGAAGRGRWSRVALAWLACLACLWAASAAHAQQPCSVTESRAYLDGRLVERTAVVVFVHGVLSSAATAWGSGEAAWPCLLRKEPAFDNSNIYVYNYDTALLGRSPPIEKVASQLRQDLINDGVMQHAHVLFVAHSMGGLVVSRTLLDMVGNPGQRALLDRVRLVQFNGTPGHGADLATIADKILGGDQFADMSNGGRFVTDLVSQWSASQWPFKWQCVAEGRRWGYAWILGTLIVPRDSAEALCRPRPGKSELLEQFDHETIVKPGSLRDTPHRNLVRTVVSCARSAVASRTRPDSQASEGHGKAMLDTLDRLRAALSAGGDDARDQALETLLQALYVSAAWADRYIKPRDLAHPQLQPTEFERLSRREFAVELLKVFQPGAGATAAWRLDRVAWVGRLSEVTAYVPDGQLVETRKTWLDAGMLAADATVVALEPEPGRGQLFVVGRPQSLPGSPMAAGLQGVFVVPASVDTCHL